MTDIHQSKSSGIVVINIVLLSVSCLVVALRLASRYLSAARFWWDDGLIIAALVLNAGSSAFNFVGAASGAGKHVQIVTTAQITTLGKVIYGIEIVYALLLTAIKSSILFLYLRLFGVRKSFKNVIILVQALVLGWCISILFASIFQKKPIKGVWTHNIPNTHGINQHAYLLGTAVPNVILDFVILFLPISIVWQLQISKRQKFALSGIFLVGAFVCGVSIVCANAVANVNQKDKTYAYASTLIWSAVEVNVGIICACLPTLSPVLQAVFGKCRGLKRGSGGTGRAPIHCTAGGSRTTASKIRGPFSRLYEESRGDLIRKRGENELGSDGDEMGISMDEVVQKEVDLDPNSNV